jgi:hypothetical protein
MSFSYDAGAGAPAAAAAAAAGAPVASCAAISESSFMSCSLRARVAASSAGHAPPQPPRRVQPRPAMRARVTRTVLAALPQILRRALRLCHLWQRTHAAGSHTHTHKFTTHTHTHTHTHKHTLMRRYMHTSAAQSRTHTHTYTPPPPLLPRRRANTPKPLWQPCFA